VDNDRFQSNQHNQQNVPQAPQTILPSTRIMTRPPFNKKTQISLPRSDVWLPMDDQGETCRGELFTAFEGRGIGAGHWPERKRVWVVSKNNSTEKKREREHRGEGMRRFGGYCRSVDDDDDEKRPGTREERGIQDNSIQSNEHIFFKLVERTPLGRKFKRSRQGPLRLRLRYLGHPRSR
jgi:hypothetical protein